MEQGREVYESTANLCNSCVEGCIQKQIQFCGDESVIQKCKLGLYKSTDNYNKILTCTDYVRKV